jgi:hypothetical protein
LGNSPVLLWLISARLKLWSLKRVQPGILEAEKPKGVRRCERPFVARITSIVLALTNYFFAFFAAFFATFFFAGMLPP